MRVEIDIDLGPLGDEWEPVAFRCPKLGEDFVTNFGDLSNANFNFNDERYLIVRRRWRFPEWLKAAWYVETSSGQQFATNSEPVPQRGGWHFPSGGFSLEGIADIPRIGGDWTQSKRRNPNYTESAK